MCTGPRQPAPALHSCSREWFPRPAPARCGVASGRGRASCGPLTVICWYLADIYCSGAAVTRQCAACSLQQPATGYGPELSSHIVSSSLAQRAARQHTSYANIVCMWRGGDWSWQERRTITSPPPVRSSYLPHNSPRDPLAQSLHRCTDCHCKSRRQKWRGRNYQWIIMLTTRIHCTCTSTSLAQLRGGTSEPLTLSLLPSGACCTSLAISRRMIVVAVPSVENNQVK